jgi:hypothetical protein
MLVTERITKERATAAVPGRVPPEVTTATGGGPAVLGVDMGVRTLIRAVQGSTIIDELKPSTPSFGDFMLNIGRASDSLLGPDRSPAAVAVSSATSLQALNRLASAYDRTGFANAVASELRMPNAENVLVFPPEGAHLIAYGIDHPPTEGNDIAYLNLNTSDPRLTRLNGAAVLTEEGWVAPYQPPSIVGEKVADVIGHTINTFNQTGLEVGTLVVAPKVLKQLGAHPRKVFGKDAPEIVAQAKGAGAIAGDVYAAGQLAEPDGQHFEAVSGISEITERRNSR